MTKICCVCQRVEDGPHWKDEYEFAPGERITHGYCPLCFDVVMADLTDYLDRRTSGSEDEEPVHHPCPTPCG